VKAIAALVFALLPAAGHAQMQMDMEHHHHDDAASPAISLLHSQAAGTSLEPGSSPMAMKMFSRGGWDFMVHGVAFLTELEQTGPRGRDDHFSVNWMMASATRKLGGGALMLRGMFTLEPFTIRNRQYPLLFQTGETAFGRPIIDGQHPHDLFMELAAEYAHPIGSGVAYLYLAPVGDPALGPVAYPHRASASEIPQAVIGHHFEDSTHISSSVVTAGYRFARFTFEASAFHGAEPDEKRTDINIGRIDSGSFRIAWSPTAHLTTQISAGKLEKPEALEPRNAKRETASISYDAAVLGMHSSTTLLWGQVQKESHHSTLDAYLAETLLRVGTHHSFSIRAERVEKDELFPHFHPPGRPDFAPAVPTFTINSLLAGYTFDFITRGPVRAGVGANFTKYWFPHKLVPFYGEDPVTRVVFLRLRLQ
jgi:hypothetical protein